MKRERVFVGRWIFWIYVWLLVAVDAVLDTVLYLAGRACCFRGKHDMGRLVIPYPGVLVFRCKRCDRTVAEDL